eukprot:808385-Pelagomonas_calceolata.AAC.1
MGGPTITRPRAQRHVSLQNLFHCGAVASVQGVVKKHCCSEPVELYGLHTTFSHDAPRESSVPDPQSSFQHC